MWVFTKYGFYSIVQKEPDVFQIRSRERRDIVNLIDYGPLPYYTDIIETSNSDYAVRILVGQEELQKILSFLGESLDYSNFKNKTDNTPDQSHKPYHEVWSIMANALGAYGNPGASTRIYETASKMHCEVIPGTPSVDMKMRSYGSQHLYGLTPWSEAGKRFIEEHVATIEGAFFWRHGIFYDESFHGRIKEIFLCSNLVMVAGVGANPEGDEEPYWDK